ncbi:MAG: hypothetical protein MUE36_10540 [Acidimicrobiales bacterium]|jgi:uncharacterized surface protein with fasciclin (FAS1) repeats|nr:hypothetical protein [Acidimicrobiales bacterium]
MKIKKFLAGAVAGSALLGSIAVAAPAGASSPARPSIVEIVASSANDNAAGQRTDRNWSDFDILLAAVQELGLADDVAGLQNATVFAPADASFRGLVADLTNTPVWRLSEQAVLDALLEIAGKPTALPGVSGAAALTETVLYHVTGENITNLPRRAFGKNITAANTFGVPDLLTNQIDPFNFFGFVGLQDGDKNDLDPFYVGRTVPASNGTVHVIAGVLRPVDLKALFPLD